MIIPYATNPTIKTYTDFDAAFNFFNQNLFSGELPHCLITLQRKSSAAGYFAPQRFITRQEHSYDVHEIALNPAIFKDKSDLEILSTLVHEMCHLWQQEYGTPSRGNYHNQEWAAKMEGIGLMPSSTGKVDGKRTGAAMSHYIIAGGRFDVAAQQFLADKSLYLQERPIVKKTSKNKNKVKYVCPKCGLKVWGKSGIKITCGECGVGLEGRGG